MTNRLLGRNGKIGAGLASVALLGGLIGTGVTASAASASSSSSLPGLYGSLPSVGGSAQSGGTITVGQISGNTPDYIFPITLAADSSVFTAYTFQDFMFSTLYYSPKGASPTIDPRYSLANLPVYSNGDKTVTITMKQGYKWASGAAVDANDVVFFIDLLKAAVKESAANYGNYTPGYFPDNVASATATSKYTVQLQLTKAYNPGFFTDNELDLITPLPSTSWDISSTGGSPLDYTQPANAKAIYDYLAKQAKDLTTYATNPLWQDADGPLKISSYTPATGAFSMVPNPAYGGPTKAKFSLLKFETFTSYTAEFNQLKSGNLTIGPVDFSVLPQVSSIKGSYSVFGYPDFGFNAAFYNFKDKTGSWNKIVAQTYIRQAFADLQDQPAYVKGLFKGAAVTAYGPIPSAPYSPYAPKNATSTPFPYSPSNAAKLLKAHGWKVVPNGTTTCAKPGSGSGECGAGIPAGASISPNLFYSSQPAVIGQQVEALAAAAKAVGINIKLTSKTFNFILQNYTDVSAPANDNKWAIEDFGGFTDDIYPTTNEIFNTGGSYNQGDFSSSTVDKLINNSIFATNASAVTAEASAITTLQPALFQPQPDLIWAVSKKLSATTVDAFTGLTQYTGVPQDWYFTK